MEKLYKLIDSFGPAWDVFIIVLAVIAFMVWMDVFVGNRIRINSRFILVNIFSKFVWWYSLHRNIIKANIKHWVSGIFKAKGKKFYVVVMANRLYVVNRSQIKYINKLIKHHKERITIHDLLRNALYRTK